MKIVALEEHLVTRNALEAWAAAPTASEDGTTDPGGGVIIQRLLDVGERRLGDMDDAGVDVQVLSLTQPSAQTLAPAKAEAIAREVNDAIAAVVSDRPDRFEGFAALPTPDPSAAAEELRRAVNRLGLKGAMLCGRTGDRNVDDPDFAEIYATAADLGVPIYIHPRLPVMPVRDAYYSGFGDQLDAFFAGFGLGWHYETGIQLLRLILSGTFDQHPDLQVIVGHWGEVVLFYLERIGALDRVGFGLERPVDQYFRENVYYTGSGIPSHRYLQWTIDVVGIERVMYATDYPYRHAGDGGARTFLEESTLDPAAKDMIAHGNWDRLTRRDQPR
ncbi:MAG: amidohydrolase family protein [Solirubrobacteraceae bacterium]